MEKKGSEREDKLKVIYPAELHCWQCLRAALAASDSPSDLWGGQHLKNLPPSFENTCSESTQMNKEGEIWPRVLSAFIDSEPIVTL